MEESIRTPLLVEAWGSWLEHFDWSHWTTLTFRPYQPWQPPGLGPARPPKDRPGPPPDYAHRAFQGFVNMLGERAGRPVAYFRGDEFGERLGRLHLHALLEGTGGLLEESVRRCWRPGFSAVEVYDPELGATHYLTKYITKSLASYDLGGRLRRRGEGQACLAGLIRTRPML